MTSIESEARGISQRHTETFHEFGMDWCSRCMRKAPCEDRLAADAITRKIEEAIESLRVILADHRQESTYPLCYAGCAGSFPCTAHLEAGAALASLQGDKT